LTEGAVWLRIVERRYAHEGNLQLAVDVQESITPRISHTCDRVPAHRECAPRKIDFLEAESDGRFKGRADETANTLMTLASSSPILTTCIRRFRDNKMVTPGAFSFPLRLMP
jgi:hypothetical protein